MAKRLDQILVIDVESTCWAGAQPEGQVSEIIEIGVCPVDSGVHVTFWPMASLNLPTSTPTMYTQPGVNGGAIAMLPG